MLAELLEQHPALPVDDALGLSGRARGKHDVERRVEIQPFEAWAIRSGVVLQRAIQPLGRRPRGQQRVTDRGALVAEAEHEGALNRRQRGQHFGELILRVKGLAAVKIAVADDHYLGPGLGEAVEDAADPEIRRARGNHRAQCVGGQRDHDRRRAVGQHEADPVALAHPALGQQRLHATDPGDQRAPAHLLGLAVFGLEDQRDVVAVGAFCRAQQVFGVADPALREVAGAGHLTGVFDDGIAGVTDDISKGPEAGPEALVVVDAEIVKVPE